MLLEVLGHAEALLTLLAEDGLHDLVGGEPLAVLLVLSIEVNTFPSSTQIHLEVFLLEIRPQLLHNLWARNLKTQVKREFPSARALTRFK